MDVPAFKDAPPAQFRFYIIFHKFLTLEAYENVNPHYIKTYCRFAGVNRKIPKIGPDTLAPYVFEEWQLPVYNPLYQLDKYCESSVFFHTYLNPELMLDPFKFVGFLHYDMVLDNRLFEFIEHCLEELKDSSKTLFIFYADAAEPHINQNSVNNDRFGYELWENVINLYNTMHGTEFILDDVRTNSIPLYHSYLVPKGIFKEMMAFADRAIPRIFDLLGCDITHLPYHIERCHGVFLLLHTLDKKIDRWVQLPGIDHRDDLKDPWQEQQTA